MQWTVVEARGFCAHRLWRLYHKDGRVGGKKITFVRGLRRTSPYSSSSTSTTKSWKLTTVTGAESGTAITSAIDLELLREVALLLFCGSREGLKPRKTLAALLRALADREELDEASNLSARNEEFCWDCPDEDERPWLSRILGLEGGVVGLSPSPSSNDKALSPCRLRDLARGYSPIVHRISISGP